MAQPETEHIVLPGLAAATTITVDRWGIPHLEAAGLQDLFLAQGFNAARDRLWQLDLWRKRGLGLLAADHGPGFLAQDRAARLFLFRGDMRAEYAAYGDDTETICAAFAAGVNAWIALCAREPERLAPEFTALRVTPGRWRPDDVLRIRSHGLTKNALSEVLRAAILARADLATDLLRKDLQPPVAPEPAAGVDLAAVPLDALDLFRLATAGATLSPERLACPPGEAELWTGVTELGEVFRRDRPPAADEPPREEGSNNWVVHGGRTEMGRPILASDPHRAHSAPSLRYLVHLKAPGLDAIGAGEPSLPGISLGHNGAIAFGLTIFGGDQEDVYLYETAPDDPDRYLGPHGWTALRVVEEEIAVRGMTAQTARLLFTEHGPVLHQSARQLVALRSAWFEPGSAAYAASLAVMRARDHAGFEAALARWGSPSVNMVYADTGGTIAWEPAGFHPRRQGWDGLLPVPGDGHFEWDGRLGPDETPRLVNPPTGFIATANELNLPDDWPHAGKPVGFEWAEPSRARRIHAVLERDTAHGVAASRALQTDVVSMPALRLLRLLPVGSDAAGFLAGWDGALHGSSGPAALFEVWWSLHLKAAVMERLVPDPAIRALLAPGDVESLLRAMEQPDGRWGAEPTRERDRMMEATLAAAWRDCAARLGPDPGGWRWGALHHGYFQHALSSVWGGAADIGPFGMGGSASTPMHAGYRPSDFRVMHGASVRLVIDVGDWDKSVCINAPGQSGDPRSPHYRDLAPLWADGLYVPLLYSAGAVSGAAERVISLSPAPADAASG